MIRCPARRMGSVSCSAQAAYRLAPQLSSARNTFSPSRTSSRSVVSITPPVLPPYPSGRFLGKAPGHAAQTKSLVSCHASAARNARISPRASGPATEATRRPRGRAASASGGTTGAPRAPRPGAPPRGGGGAFRGGGGRARGRGPRPAVPPQDVALATREEPVCQEARLARREAIERVGGVGPRQAGRPVAPGEKP